MIRLNLRDYNLLNAKLGHQDALLEAAGFSYQDPSVLGNIQFPVSFCVEQDACMNGIRIMCANCHSFHKLWNWLLCGWTITETFSNGIFWIKWAVAICLSTKIYKIYLVNNENNNILTGSYSKTSTCFIWTCSTFVLVQNTVHKGDLNGGG